MRSTAGTRSRAWLEKEQINYVLAVACDEMIAAVAGPRRAGELAALVPAGAWQRLSCADGSKGSRLYDWALMETAAADRRLLAPGPCTRARKASLSSRSSAAGCPAR
jgi:hypothetical protein